MKIMIAGGTGFIGRALIKHFSTQQHEITVVGRAMEKIQHTFQHAVAAMTWQQLAALSMTELKSFDVIINLAGANIGDRVWTASRKQCILESRIKPTQLLAQLCSQLGPDSPSLLNASAIGVYGLQKTQTNHLPPALDENTPINFSDEPDFLAQVGRQWELATEPARAAGVRVVNMRFGVVLGKNGGVLAKLKLPFLFGMGGKIGSGYQPFCWIALSDLIQAIEFIIQESSLKGPINLVAPQTVMQLEFAHTLANILHRPCFMPTPAFALKFIFRQMAEELLLNGQHVVPTLLVQHGFKFQYPDLRSALTVSL